MRKILILIIVLLGLTFADMIKDHAYVISAIGIKNTTGEIAYVSGSTNTPNTNGSYNLVPQVIIYDGTTSYVGAATPFTGCIGDNYYFSSEKKGSCFMGGAMKGATASTKGESGLVPAPAAGQQSLFLRGDGKWAAPEGKNYSNATTSASGLMSAADKTKLNGISESADSVSFSRSLSSGTKIGSVTINGTSTDMYAPTDTNTKYSTGTGISLSGTTFSNSGVRSVSTGSSNGTISVNTNGSTSNVAVKGLGSAAYTNSGSYASSSHSHIDLLWTNSNPNNAFAEQTINLSTMSNYQFVIIEARYEIPPSTRVQTAIFKVGCGSALLMLGSEGDGNNIKRPVTINSNSIDFGTGGFNNVYDNKYARPTRIWGLK